MIAIKIDTPAHAMTYTLRKGRHMKSQACSFQYPSILGARDASEGFLAREGKAAAGTRVGAFGVGVGVSCPGGMLALEPMDKSCPGGFAPLPEPFPRVMEGGFWLGSGLGLGFGLNLGLGSAVNLGLGSAVNLGLAFGDGFGLALGDGMASCVSSKFVLDSESKLAFEVWASICKVLLCCKVGSTGLGMLTGDGAARDAGGVLAGSAGITASARLCAGSPGT